MNKTIIFLLAASVWSCNSLQESKELPIMGDLVVGEYGVGYRTLFLYDQTKTPVPYANWEGKIFEYNSKPPGRQHQVSVWYPAQVGTGEGITYRHYVNLMGRHTEFEDNPELGAFAEQMFINQTNALAGKDDFTRDDLNTLLELEVLARQGAKPIEKRFPVIYFPNGSTPAYQSIMAEYLASHGYVVVGFAAKGRYSSGLEISTLGLELAVDDMEFVINKTAELSMIDHDRIGLMANAISSSVCVLAACKNPKIKATISLEGGFPSEFEQRLLNDAAYYQVENLTLPILHIYSPHPAIDPEFTFHVKYAPRYYARFPRMSEFVMLNYGMFDSFVPNIIGEHKGSPQKGFEAASLLTMQFLDHHVKSSENESFDEMFSTYASSEIDTTFYHEALQVPPNIARMKSAFLSGGFDAIDSTYQSLKQAGNNQPFSKVFYNSYKDWLAWKKDPEYEYRKRLYELAIDSYPESAKVNYYLGYYAGKIGDNNASKTYYTEAIALADKDTDLSPSELTAIKRNANEALATMK